MKSALRPLVLLGILVTPALVQVACQNSFKDCADTSSCPPEGDGDGDLGGNSGDGDGDGDGDGTGGGGGGAPSACDPECDGDTPHCDDTEDPAVCVECLNEGDCTGDEKCSEDGECVGCLEHADCDDPSAPMCEEGECTSGCAGAEDCTRFDEQPVCDEEAGACVGCLDEGDCDGNVCAPGTQTCTELEAGALFACEECVHDAQCQAGQLCVEQSFPSSGGEVIGTFCTWRKDGRPATESVSCFMGGKPFATAREATSVDGEAAVLCVLRSTTCPAFLQHSQVIPGCIDETAMSDGACGEPDVDDGLCRENTGGDELCTYPCLSAADCSGSSTCVGEPDGYCSL